MMNVLFITRKWPPAVGGMETYSAELTNELAKKPISLTNYKLAGKKNGQPPGFLSLSLFFSKSFFLCLKKRNYDVIHLGDMALWPIALAAKISSTKRVVIISAHGTDIAYHIRQGILPNLYKIYLKIGAKFLKHRVHIIANSGATASHCKRFKFKHISIIKLGVKLKSHNKYATKLTKGAPYLLFVGRLVTGKGVSWFINNVLNQLPPQIILKIAGIKRDNSEWSAVEKSEKVEFIGAKYGQELASLRENSLAVIMPNINCNGKYFEGFGLTALEAPADGGILIASKIDGIKDAVIDGKTGWLIESSNADQWVKKIHEISSWSKVKRLAFIKEAKLHLLRNYSWANVGKETMDIYIKNIDKIKTSKK